MALNDEKKIIKEKVTASFQKAIKENFGTVDSFSQQKGIPKEEAEKMLNQDFHTMDEFLNAIFYTNSSLTFSDCFGNEIIFPQPRQSDF